MVHLSDNVFKMDYRAFYKAVFRIWSFFIMMFLSDGIIYLHDFIVFIYVDFIWNKCGIVWFYDIFLLWIFSFLLRYIHIIFIWLIYNLLAIDLFLSDCSIIMVFFCDNSIIFLLSIVGYCELFWLIYWLI